MQGKFTVTWFKLLSNETESRKFDTYEEARKLYLSLLNSDATNEAKLTETVTKVLCNFCNSN